VTTFYNKNGLLRYILVGEIRITAWLAIPLIQRRKLWGRTMQFF